LTRRLFLLVVSVVAGSASVATAQRPAVACDPDNGGLVLPAGFCASLFATVGSPRHVAVGPNGDVFVSGTRDGVTALRDRDGDGHADTTATFGAGYGIGTGIAITGDAIYYAPNDKVVRFSWRPGSLLPSDAGTVIVTGLPTGGHTAKPITLGKDGSLFVDQGSPGNVCVGQGAPRRGEVSTEPFPVCADLEHRAGIWRYDGRKPGQTIADGERWVTGFRNGMAIGVEPTTGVLWGATHGRDQLGVWPGYTVEDNAEKPAEEFGMLTKGSDFGWPYCYYDPIARKKMLAPEYGGDNVKQGPCGQKTQPVIAFPGHWAPLQLAFVPPRNSLGAAYASGAFIAFHGSWNRAPLPQDGFRIVFIPFKDGKATGQYSTFAKGAGSGPPSQIKLSGVAVAPEGNAIYLASDQVGKVWRIVPTGGK
jgi:glucose/arabinose dehydrogenase